ncbi:FHA domain-containing protein [Streptomyces sp. NPDC047108]|uniref:FHA domain-containing protein n=1 Tax=Streptomyces sp. NPDC047108 TaxID=3155025 RepID=UPI0033D55322
MPTCPNGHQSGSDDWCEICGHRMAGAGVQGGAVAPPPPPPPVPGGPGAHGAPQGGYGYPNPNQPPQGGYGYPSPDQPQQGGYGYPNPNQPPQGGYDYPGPDQPQQGGYGYPNPSGPPGPSPYGQGPGPASGPVPGQGPGPATGHGFDPNATGHAELCPQCRTPREAMAPFCEECRYNFLTHSPTFTPPAPPAPGTQGGPPGFPSMQPQGPGAGAPPQTPQAPQAPQPPNSFDYQSSRPSQMNRPAEPLAPPHPGQEQQPLHGGVPHGAPQGAPQAPYAAQAGFPQAPPAPGPAAAEGHGDDWTLPPPAQGPGHGQGPGQAPAPGMGQFPGEPQAAPPANWTAVIGPDREYFLAMMNRSGPEAAGLNLPAYSPEQQLVLSGSQITIGRRRNSTGESPDIDLSRPPEDPGVSHKHAVLVSQPDGSWSVVDQDSTNGTTVNGGEEPIQPFVPVPLQDGDRVHVGAWTTITLHRG